MTKPLAEIVREIDGLYRQMPNSDWPAGKQVRNKDVQLYLMFLDAWPTIRAALENGAGWVSVEEGLPQRFAHVLVCFADSNVPSVPRVCQDTLYWNDKAWFTGGEVKYTGEVTHWQPLPQPPKERV